MSQLATDEMLTMLKAAISAEFSRRFQELQEWVKTLAPPAESTAGKSAWQQRVEDRKQRVQAFLSDYYQVCLAHHMIIQRDSSLAPGRLEVYTNISDATAMSHYKNLRASEGIS